MTATIDVPIGITEWLPFETNPVVGLLLAAADLLESDGWCQGIFTNDDGEHCLVGAIGTAWGTGPDYFSEEQLGQQAEMAVERYLGGIPIIGWNDATGRTKEEVVAALRDAAVTELSRGVQQ